MNRESVFKEVINELESVRQPSGEWWIYECGIPHRSELLHFHGQVIAHAVVHEVRSYGTTRMELLPAPQVRCPILREVEV